MPASASPAPAPATVAAPPVVVEAAVVVPVEPENLAATSLHQKMQVVPIPTEPALDQLKEDTRIAEAARAAGLRRVPSLDSALRPPL